MTTRNRWLGSFMCWIHVANYNGTKISETREKPTPYERERSSPELPPQAPSSKYVKKCCGCGGGINDRFVMAITGISSYYHQECLRCCACESHLDTTCYFKENNLYCKTDYIRSLGIRCAKCTLPLAVTDWVRKARKNIYHLACFVCDACNRQLGNGDEFSLLDNKVLCKQHYFETIEGGTTSNDEATDGEGPQRKNKRVRTTFTDEQQSILQTNFRMDSNPDGQDLERIAQLTGLTRRVTQVWFQNSRARQKKHMSSKKHHGGEHAMHDMAGGIQRTLDLHFLYAPYRPQSTDIEDSSSPDTPMMHMMHEV